MILAQPLLAGAPATGASAQVVAAFVDREGGSFFQEWSALFVVEAGIGRASLLLLSAVESESGSRVARSERKSGAGWKPPKSGGAREYERALQTQAAAGLPRRNLFAKILQTIAGPLTSVGLHASFIALPFTDTNDGQTVLCYRSYFPAAMAAVY